jgi:hypothetical protein
LIRVIILTLFLFLSSCAGTQKQMVNLSHSPHSWQIVDSDEAPNPIRVSQAVTIFYRQWQKTFGDKEERIKKNLNELMIEWSSKEKAHENVVRNKKGQIVITRKIVKGMTICPTYIWLKTNQYKRVFASSLVHELVHVALWTQVCRGGDPDHEAGYPPCWTAQHTKFIRHVNNILIQFDI